MRIKLWMLLCILSISSAFAQDMKSVFISMPDSIAPLLTKVNKEDCVDFLAYDMKAEVKNRFGGVTELKVLTDDYLFLQTTANSSMEMKLLPVNDSTKVVCMIKTVCSSACDSEVHFYSSDWKQKLMTTDYLSKPEGDMFFLPVDSSDEEYALIRKEANVHLMKASLSKEDVSLTFIYTTTDYLNRENKEKLEPYLRKEPVVLKWQEGKFR
ncbi:MAG: DUF3256 family protein [Bacteroidaceae bacterium]|nr:DUF3256 family protein [Bacteroidaceae bacterium]